MGLKRQVPGFQVPGISILGNEYAVSGTDGRLLLPLLNQRLASPLARARARATSNCSARPHCACSRGGTRGGTRGGEGRAELAQSRSQGESMATLRRLREVPRHLLVCEKSNFGHDKSRHRHLVETHYHNYRVSSASVGLSCIASSPGAGEVWGRSRSVEPRARPPRSVGRGSSPGILGIVISSLLRAGRLRSCRTTTPRMRRGRGQVLSSVGRGWAASLRRIPNRCCDFDPAAGGALFRLGSETWGPTLGVIERVMGATWTRGSAENRSRTRCPPP